MAKTLIVFDIADKPENMGQMQTVEGKPDGDGMKTFLKERKKLLPDATISKDGTKLTFTKDNDEDGNPIMGIAHLSIMPDDFKIA